MNDVAEQTEELLAAVEMADEQPPQAVANLPAAPSSGSLIGMMERLAANPDIPTEKLRELLDLQERILDREAEQAFAEAMARAQEKMPVVAKDAENEHTKSTYARLEAISKAITPIYTAEGLSLTCSEEASPKDNHIRVVGILRHKLGYKEQHHVDVAIDSVGSKGTVNKTATQAAGSTFTYGRRYLKCMIFDIATGDDNDGNGAGLQRLNEEQVEQLEQKVKDTGANRAAFLRWAKVDEPSQILAKNFERVMEQLDVVAKSKRSNKSEPAK